MTNRAVFLDRDGTLVHPQHFPSHPDHLRIYDGVAEELRSLQRLGWKLVVITNQSGIARGFFDERALHRMHTVLAERLARHGVWINEFYFCPHHPNGTVPEFATTCDCRKPQPGMLFQARDELQVDLARSWFVGDILDDVEAGRRANCRTILVDLKTEPMPEIPLRTPDFIGQDTVHALRIIQHVEHGRQRINTNYQPEGWRSPLMQAADDRDLIGEAR